MTYAEADATGLSDIDRACDDAALWQKQKAERQRRRKSR